MDPPDIDGIVAQLRAAVDARRAAGSYPPGLEDDLAAHFRRISDHRAPDPDLGDVKAALLELEKRLEFSTDRIPLDSGLPGGQRVHRALARAQARQIEGVLRQVREFGEAARDVGARLARAVGDPTSHVHADLLGQIDALLDRLTALDRSPGADVADLQRRLERLEDAEARRRFRPSFSWERFYQAFPPPPAAPELADRLVGHQPVLVLGCRRGEFLGVLSERGIEARGVEPDEELASMAQAAGLAVDVADPVLALAAVPDGSLGGLALVHVLERLRAQEVDSVVALAGDKLAAGGVLVCEAVEPTAVSTVVSPVPLHAVTPEYLAFLLSEAGFAPVEQLVGTPLAYAVAATR